MELVALVRAGDTTAYSELWSRYYQPAVRVARSITSTFDADDIAQEAFTTLFDRIQAGGGPRTAFRAYLMTSVRNVAAGWGRKKREDASDDIESHLAPVCDEEDIALSDERQMLSTAFSELPERWQKILWYSEVEEMTVSEISARLEMKPGAVAQLAFRAREGLRETYIQSHLKLHPGASEECSWFVSKAGAVVRETASTRDMTRATKHLTACAHCQKSVTEAKNVNRRLMLLLPPLLPVGAVAQEAFGAGAAPASASVLGEGAAVTEGTAVAEGTALDSVLLPEMVGQGFSHFTPAGASRIGRVGRRGKRAASNANKIVIGSTVTALALFGGTAVAANLGALSDPVPSTPQAAGALGAPFLNDKNTVTPELPLKSPRPLAPLPPAPVEPTSDTDTDDAPNDWNPQPEVEGIPKAEAPAPAAPVPDAPAPPAPAPEAPGPEAPAPLPPSEDSPSDDDSDPQDPEPPAPEPTLPDRLAGITSYTDTYADGYVYITVEATGSPGFELIVVINDKIGGRGIVGADGTVTIEAIGEDVVFNRLQVLHAVLHEDDFEEFVPADLPNLTPAA